MMLSLEDIRRAQARIKPYVLPTLLERAPGLGERCWLKLENTNQTHSFKVRGALNAVLSLDETARSRGIVAASSGNHAQGLAHAAFTAGIPAKILMPKHTPRRKIEGAKRYGAEVVLFGKTYDEAEAEGRRLEQVEQRTFISPYNDLNVIAGAGTIGLEIVEALPTVERVIVCVSGGGLIAGVAAAVKSLKSEIEVIGVNALSSPAMYNVFYQTHYPQNYDTLAEALSGDIEEGSVTIPLAQQYVDQIVLVTEDEIAAAIRWMVDDQGWMIEGGGAVGVAALLHDKVPHDGRVTAVVVSGGNVDGNTLRRVLNEGM
ncbi:MAG: threonine/serine dehydratase [bacterium]|nr:threonine/serine dehydratase [bacterium]